MGGTLGRPPRQPRHPPHHRDRRTDRPWSRPRWHPLPADAHDGQYRLSPQVGLDWGRFHALVASGEDDTPEGLEALRSALELVRGVPLTSPTGRGYEWAVVHRTEMEMVIAEVAERLALRCLDLGNHRQANWAARRGLLASPYDERLYRVLMRAADAAGNPAGVDAVRVTPLGGQAAEQASGCGPGRHRQLGRQSRRRHTVVANGRVGSASATGASPAGDPQTTQSSDSQRLVGRRYLSESSMALVLAGPGCGNQASHDHQEVNQLTAP